MKFVLLLFPLVSQAMPILSHNYDDGITGLTQQLIISEEQKGKFKTDSITGLRVDMRYPPKSAEKCVGVRLIVPRGKWTLIKNLREQLFWEAQGDAWCTVYEYACKTKCKPLVIQEAN